jgi:hypothetical protein
VKTSELELNEAKLVEKFEKVNVPQQEPETIEHLDAEMSALECTFEGCTSGVGGAKFKTPAGDLAQKKSKFFTLGVREAYKLN